MKRIARIMIKNTGAKSYCILILLPITLAPSFNHYVELTSIVNSNTDNKKQTNFRPFRSWRYTKKMVFTTPNRE